MEIITQYILPKEAYPRYEYTTSHVERLSRRSQRLIRKAGMKDTERIPSFGNVIINIQSEPDKQLLTKDEIVLKKTEEDVEMHEIGLNELFEKSKLNSGHEEQPIVWVTSFSEAKRRNVPDHFGKIIIFISEEDQGNEKITYVKGRTEYDTFTQAYICVSSRKDFSTDLRDLLERYTFRVLKERVDVLQCFLKASELKARTESPEDKIGETRTKEQYAQTLLQKYRMMNSFLKTSMLLVKGSEWRTPMRQLSVEKLCSYMNEQVQISELDTLFTWKHEEGATGIARQNTSERQTYSREDGTRLEKHIQIVSDPDVRQSIKDLVAEIKALFQRSNVPVFEKPEGKCVVTCTKEEVPKELFEEIPNATSCGYRLGTFHVTVDENENTTTPTPEIEELIRTVLQRHGIHEFVLRFKTKSSEQLFSCSSGTAISINGHITENKEEEKIGTVGGFVLKGSGKELCAITARHVVDVNDSVRVRCDKSNTLTEIGRILRPISNFVEFLSPVDIAAIRIDPQFVGECNTQYRNFKGMPTNSKLYDFAKRTIDPLDGLHVHIHGASQSSKPGVGIVTMPESFDRTKNAPWLTNIIIEDLPYFSSDSEDEDEKNNRNGATAQPEGKPFSMKGDSGSIVCADDQDGEFVHVISVLCGRYHDTDTENRKSKIRYQTFELKKGLVQLKIEQGSIDDFEIC